MASAQSFYRAIKRRRVYDPAEVATWLTHVSSVRIAAITDSMATYIGTNLPAAIRSKSGLADYRTSPYVLMAAAGALELADLDDLSKFLIDLKLYMGLETSFGKSIEKIVMPHYPIDVPGSTRWESPQEKEAEFASYDGLTREEKSQARVDSVWREIDAACVHEGRRHLLSIKSGTQTINDTQVDGMFTAIRYRHQAWLDASRAKYGVTGIDVVIGLTYGTDWSTNNKENQILNKLLSVGFEELDRDEAPGVLINADNTVRVYRCVGVDYWSYAANPHTPERAEFAFLEVLLGIAGALRQPGVRSAVADALSERLALLSAAIADLQLHTSIKDIDPKDSTPLAAAISSFFDEQRGPSALPGI